MPESWPAADPADPWAAGPPADPLAAGPSPRPGTEVAVVAAEVDRSAGFPGTGSEDHLAGWPNQAPGATGLDPDLDDPRLAAAQYRRLLAASDQARARADQHTRERLRGSRATARRHREAAADIRVRVENVWQQVAGPLAPYGLTELDQLRAAPADDGPGAGPFAPTAAEQRGGRPLARARRDGPGPERGGENRGRGVALGPSGPGRSEPGRSELGRSGSGRPGLDKVGQARGEDRAGGGAHARARGRADRGRGGRAGPSAAPSAGPAPVDPRTAPREAYELCLEAMSKAAELRAVSRASSSASAGLLTALACLLSLVIVGALRAFASAQAVPCLLGAAVAAAALVMIGSGGEEGAVKAAFRAGMLGAGTAAVAVLATFRLAPMEPLGVVAALVALAAALRFGLGFGGGSPPPEPAGRSRKG